MFNQNDEIEQLWVQCNQVNILESSNYSHIYKCNNCKRQASAPVVTHCGHIYCWKCLAERFKQNNCKCSCCKQELKMAELRPIYVSGMDHMDFHPRRPKAKNLQPIINNTRFSTGSNQNLQVNNVESGKVVAGLGYFPSTFILAFVKVLDIQSSFSQPSTNNLSSMQKNITISINRIQTVLIISIPLLVIIFLLLSNII